MSVSDERRTGPAGADAVGPPLRSGDTLVRGDRPVFRWERRLPPAERARLAQESRPCGDSLERGPFPGSPRAPGRRSLRYSNQWKPPDASRMDRRSLRRGLWPSGPPVSLEPDFAFLRQAFAVEASPLVMGNGNRDAGVPSSVLDARNVSSSTVLPSQVRRLRPGLSRVHRSTRTRSRRMSAAALRQGQHWLSSPISRFS